MPVSPVLAIDLGGTRLRVALADSAGTILARDEEPVQDPDPSALLPRIVDFGRSLFAKTGAAGVDAVGVSTPGLADADTGVVVAARNLGWRDVPLARVLSEGFDAPAAIENDANCAVLGEQWRGAGRGHRDVACVSVGTGVGVGIIADGTLVRGARFAAGELGRLPCGDETVEDVAGGPGIVRRARERGLEPTTTAAVFDAAAAGDRRAAEVVLDAVRALATAMTAVIVVLDPGIVVIGGGVAAQGERLLAPLRDEVARRIASPCPIVLSSLGGDAQILGAASLALRLAGGAR